MKGYQCLLHAAALLKQRGMPFALRLAGNGILREQLVGLSRELALQDNVEFLG